MYYCADCEQNLTCRKAGMPRIKPENLQALEAYNMLKDFGSYLPRALIEYPVGLHIRLSIIAAEHSRNEMKRLGAIQSKAKARHA